VHRSPAAIDCDKTLSSNATNILHKAVTYLHLHEQQKTIR